MCPGRKAVPDIDVDFDDKGRQRVVEWLKEKYGKNNSAHIITFSKMLPERTFKEIAQLEKIPEGMTEKLYNAIPNEWRHLALKTAIQFSPELQKAGDSDAAIRNAIQNTMKLERSVCGMGVHACGLVFSDAPITDFVPVCVQDSPYREGERLLCTQYDGLTVESAGLVKWDFLGLVVLGKIKEICSAIKESQGIDVDMEHIPLDDTKSFKLFQSGKTTGVFQFDSKGMQQYLKYMHPTAFEDLVLLNVMYRPGLMDWIPEIIERKKGRKTIKYAIPNMEKYLKDTYGLAVYQEQIMLLSSLLADFNRIERDNLRKALGKRKQDELVIMKEKFFAGGKKNGYKKTVLKEIWEDWDLLGRYAFNKAHAVCYTWIAYQTAYLKAHYPEEFSSCIKEQ
jgi:DNA polymerase-3 subunit alpha